MKLSILSLSNSRQDGMFNIDGERAEAVMDKMIETGSGIVWSEYDADEGATAIYNKFMITTKQLRELYKSCK